MGERLSITVGRDDARLRVPIRRVRLIMRRQGAEREAVRGPLLPPFRKIKAANRRSA